MLTFNIMYVQVRSVAISCLACTGQVEYVSATPYPSYCAWLMQQLFAGDLWCDKTFSLPPRRKLTIWRALLFDVLQYRWAYRCTDVKPDSWPFRRLEGVPPALFPMINENFSANLITACCRIEFMADHL